MTDEQTKLYYSIYKWGIQKEGQTLSEKECMELVDIAVAFSFSEVSKERDLNHQAENHLGNAINEWQDKCIALENLCSEAMGEQPKEWRDRFKKLITKNR